MALTSQSLQFIFYNCNLFNTTSISTKTANTMATISGDDSAMMVVSYACGGKEWRGWWCVQTIFTMFVSRSHCTLLSLHLQNLKGKLSAQHKQFHGVLSTAYLEQCQLCFISYCWLGNLLPPKGCWWSLSWWYWPGPAGTSPSSCTYSLGCFLIPIASAL